MKILINELKKEFFILWSYKIQWFGEFVSLIFLFVFLSFFNTSLNSGLLYGVWFYSILIIGDVSNKISLDTKAGNIEQIYLSPIPSFFIYIIKIASTLIKSFFMLSIFLILLFICNLNITFDLRVMVSIFIITPGLFGLSFILGGLTLVFKETSFIVTIVNNLLLFLSGIFLPLSHLPDWLQLLSFYLPTTQAIYMITETSVPFNKFVTIISINIIYVLIGFIAFIFSENYAKRKGILLNQ